MEGIRGGAASATASIAKWRSDFSRAFQYYLDRSTPHPVKRWLGTLCVAAIYALRVYHVEGFYVVSYCLGMYFLILLIGFLSPKFVQKGKLGASDGASLPTKASDEFKPFIRRLPEFKFWYSMAKAFFIAFGMTFFSMLDVDVYWPTLVLFWVIIFVHTMGQRIQHMMRYKYIPFSIGKQRYNGKK